MADCTTKAPRSATVQYKKGRILELTDVKPPA
jgi:hypothetical protein